MSAVPVVPRADEGWGEGALLAAEGCGDAELLPLPLPGEGWGDAELLPLPLAGEGCGDAELLPLPLAGEGWGEGADEVAAVRNACVVGDGCASAASSSVSRTMPSDTLSPIFTVIARTIPAAGDGTSIVALSDSSVTSGSSGSTLSPDFTSTSITGTSRKSPMSGTFTSTLAMRESFLLS